MSGHVVHSVERNGSRLCRSSTKDSCYTTVREGGEFGPLFPPWTVTRSQWLEMTRPSISGVAIDTLLFSRIGVLLFHRYRIISRTGTHLAFRGTYMRRLHAFLEESDAESVHHHYRRCAKEMPARMSQSSGRRMFLLDTQSLVRQSPGPSDLASQCGGPVLLGPRTWFPYLSRKRTWSKR